MSEQITIARPYAKAAFDFASEQKKIDEWQRALLLVAEISEQSSIKSLIDSDMRAESISKIFIDICEDALDKYQQNFVKVVAENNRLAILPEVLDLFVGYRQEQELTMHVEVVSASPLTATQLEKISQALEKKSGKKVELNTKIDSELISGFIIRAGDFVIDNSIKTRLTRLSFALQS